MIKYKLYHLNFSLRICLSHQYSVLEHKSFRKILAQIYNRNHAQAYKQKNRTSKQCCFNHYPITPISFFVYHSVTPKSPMPALNSWSTSLSAPPIGDFGFWFYVVRAKGVNAIAKVIPHRHIAHHEGILNPCHSVHNLCRSFPNVRKIFPCRTKI